MTRLTANDARNLANSFGFPLERDFHSLDSTSVERILSAADSRNYRKPSGANGSRARCFYAYLNRALTAKVPEYVIQQYTSYGWEDETSEDNMREARARIKEYRENAPGAYRIVTRRVPA